MIEFMPQMNRHKEIKINEKQKGRKRKTGGYESSLPAAAAVLNCYH